MVNNRTNRALYLVDHTHSGLHVAAMCCRSGWDDASVSRIVWRESRWWVLRLIVVEPATPLRVSSCRREKISEIMLSVPFILSFPHSSYERWMEAGVAGYTCPADMFTGLEPSRSIRLPAPGIHVPG